MIRINLLPPEFRRRSGSGMNPEMLGLAAGVLVSVLVIGFWGFVAFVRIPAAEAKIEQLKKDLEVAKREADKVRAIEAEISAFRARLKVLDDLIQQKVPWAATLSDFGDMLGRDRWSMGGFQVAATTLNISPASGGGGRSSRGRGKESADQQYSFRWNMELVGQDFDLAGNYLYTFFTDVKETDFWVRNGFLGDPVEPYTTDAPKYLDDIERVKVTHSLLWVRSQNQQKANLEYIAQQEAEAAKAKGKPGKEAAPKEDG